MWPRSARRTKAAAEHPGSVWLGQLGFDVPTGSSLTMGRMTVQLEERALRFLFYGREQGVLDRDHFRAWLARPTGPMTTEWLTFSIRRNRLHLAMGAAPTQSFPLPQNFVRALREVA